MLRREKVRRRRCRGLSRGQVACCLLVKCLLLLLSRLSRPSPFLYSCRCCRGRRWATLATRLLLALHPAIHGAQVLLHNRAESWPGARPQRTPGSATSPGASANQPCWRAKHQRGLGICLRTPRAAFVTPPKMLLHPCYRRAPLRRGRRWRRGFMEKRIREREQRERDSALSPLVHAKSARSLSLSAAACTYLMMLRLEVFSDYDHHSTPLTSPSLPRSLCPLPPSLPLCLFGRHSISPLRAFIPSFDFLLKRLYSLSKRFCRLMRK